MRRDPEWWFASFGRWLDEETKQPTRGAPNVLQRRVFEHYRRCQAEGVPCRMVVVKYRRAGSSTAAAGLIYMHALNYTARLGMIGTDYKASTNMMQMIRTFAKYDDFPGWTNNGERPGANVTKKERVTPAQWSEDTFPYSDFDGKVSKSIETELTFRHGTQIELYTAQNPEAARSAGLNGYHATECGRWKKGGIMDASETLSSMRNALPKKGFHVAIEESTAHGAQGAFYETCRTARWPEYATWPDQFKRRWPLAEQRFGKELQFVLIFSGWFEDSRNVPKDPLSAEDEQFIRNTLDKDERELIANFQREGPRGPRLGEEVNATMWEQLAWRRGIIATVCTKGGVEEFKTEYPSTVAESFRSSGSPALDADGVLALETMARRAPAPQTGKIDQQGRFTATDENSADWLVWEMPIDRCRYSVIVDAMSSAEAVTGTGEKDRTSIIVLRDGFLDQDQNWCRPAVVARVKPPCQWESALATAQIFAGSMLYGGAIIVIEAASAGVAMLVKLHQEYNANLFLREIVDKTSDIVTERLGWMQTEAARRVAIDALQEAVREQEIEVYCTHITGELASLVTNDKGKVEAGGSAHDDDAIALAIGLATIRCATKYEAPREKVKREADDTKSWKVIN